jgi:CubicO group peptidase (beta-lactamase class C family)
MTTEIQGYCDVSFLPLRDAFMANFEDGLEIGASLAATYRGRMVADMWAGYADPGRARLWEQDTIVPVASTTKIMLMIGALIVIERGLLDLNAPVASYWPEFAQGGKEAVTVRDALTHQAGVPGFEVPLTNAEACDWTAATGRIAAERHWFGGERRICYHALTYGFLLGELIRRVDGRRPRQFLSEEIFDKVGADCQIGLSSPAELSRTAMPTIPTGAFDLKGIAGKLLNSVDRTDSGSWERMSSENPGNVGYTNGRAIARACAILANGGEFNGVRILSPETIALAGAEHAYGPCPYLGPLRLGLGFGIDSKEFPAPSPTSIHWGGFGGSGGLIDPKAAFSLGYTPNNWVVPDVSSGQFAIDRRVARFWDALSKLLPTL